MPIFAGPDLTCFLPNNEHEAKIERPDRRPTAREYVAYVAALIAGLTLTHVAQTDTTEEVLGHMSSEIIRILGAGLATASLLRWIYQEAGFISRTRDK